MPKPVRPAEPPAARRATVTVELSAVIAAASTAGPAVLAVRRGGEAMFGLPSGPLEATHRTLEAGLRSWVEEQTQQQLGHVEQLYTFGDRDRDAGGGDCRALSIGYLALVREARPAGSAEASWQSWYRHFPWEDRRDGRPPALDRLEARLVEWAAAPSGEAERRLRHQRLGTTFAVAGEGWIEDRVLERYELLYGAGLVAEARRDRRLPDNASPDNASPENASVDFGPVDFGAEGEPMTGDHRRILATAIGRLRGKIKYRPIVFELMPPAFTFLQLQRTVEGLSGVRLHKPNFRRLVEQQGLVEETGAMTPETGGRPARLLRFRAEVLLERPAPGLRMPRARSTG